MTPRGRAASPLEALAPDQRAAVELVLRQGRSYRELGELLGIGEGAVRARAHGALEALAPDLAPPAEADAIADWLLGQQDEAERARTRALLASDRGARRWAETVAAPLRETGGDRVPAIPTAGDPGDDAALPPPRPRDGASRRPLRTEPDAPAGAPEPGPPAASAAQPAVAGRAGRSSRLGGAILIGVAVLAVAGLLAFLLTRGGGNGSQRAASNAPAATATAQATPQQAGNDIVLRGPAGSNAAGLMRLFRTQQGTVQFALAAQGVPPNRRGEVYAIWFTKKDGSARRLGFAQAQVGKDGILTTGGPQSKDVRSFPRWFATYDHVIVTRETSAGAKRPGPPVLSGTLPRAGG